MINDLRSSLKELKQKTKFFFVKDRLDNIWRKIIKFERKLNIEFIILSEACIEEINFRRTIKKIEIIKIKTEKNK